VHGLHAGLRHLSSRLTSGTVTQTQLQRGVTNFASPHQPSFGEERVGRLGSAGCRAIASSIELTAGGKPDTLPDVTAGW